MSLLPYLHLLAGGVLLYLGAEWLVGGASRLALALRVPSLVVGLTVVAYGTSAPETVVSVQAALAGNGGIALGNIIGSNIANLGLILGLSTLIKPAKVSGELRGRELPVLVAAALALSLVLADSVATRAEMALLLVAGVAYTVWALAGSRQRRAVQEAEKGARIEAEAASVTGAPAGGSAARNAAVALAGLGLLLVGGGLFVEAAQSLALSWGMSGRVVGLTVVALGTSLPELVTSVVAAFRGHSDIAVGNVVGSNILNVLFCLGVAGTLHPLRTDPGSLAVDLGVMLLLTLVGAAFLRTERMLKRWEGGVLLGAYGLYMAWLVLGG